MIGRVRMLSIRPRKSIIWKHIRESNSAFSAQASVMHDENLPRFRTMENNPRNHDERHIGKFYTIPPETRERLFFAGGIPRLLNEQMKTFRENCIMVRKPAVEIISYLKNLNFSYPAVRFVLYGKNGVGKSVALIHLLHYGHVEKFLLLHIPWVSNWTKTPKETVASQTHPERIDLPLASTTWLQHFKMQNLEVLRHLDLKASKTYTWSQREVTEEGQPLVDIIEHGLNRGRHSSDCIAVLLKEIKQQSSTGKFKTLVVIDGVNAFYSPTNYFHFRRPDKSPIKATEITIVRAFEKMIRNDWNNAAVIATVETNLGPKAETVEVPYTPRALLGKEGFEVLDPFIPVFADIYTDKEIESVLDYYTERQWLQHEDAHKEKGRAELKFLSGHNPYQFMRACDSL